MHVAHYSAITVFNMTPVHMILALIIQATCDPHALKPCAYNNSTNHLCHVRPSSVGVHDDLELTQSQKRLQPDYKHVQVTPIKFNQTIQIQYYRKHTSMCRRLISKQSHFYHVIARSATTLKYIRVMLRSCTFPSAASLMY